MDVSNCTGEGAEQAQVVVLGNDCQVVGGKFWAARNGNQTAGIQIGVAGVDPAPAATFVMTKVINCGSARWSSRTTTGSAAIS